MTATSPILRASSTASAVHRTSRARLLAVAVLLGLLAPLLSVAAPAQASPVPKRSTMELYLDWTVYHLINAERAQHGVAPVRMNWNLRTSGRHHNVTMSRYNTMAHQLPRETDFSRRMSSAGYNWSWAGENIAWNSAMNKAGVVVLQHLMYNETAPYNGHRLNILNRHFKDVGVDVYMDRAHHKLWLTTDFGRR